jgi:hypothetical protein
MLVCILPILLGNSSLREKESLFLFLIFNKVIVKYSREGLKLFIRGSKQVETIDEN